MIFFGVVLGICIMGAIIYMAVDKKSNFHTRVASLIALALMMLTVAICLFMVFTDTRVPVDESVVIVGAPAEVKEVSSNNVMVLTLLVFFLILMFLIVAVFAMRENRRNMTKAQGNVSIW